MTSRNAAARFAPRPRPIYARFARTLQAACLAALVLLLTLPAAGADTAPAPGALDAPGGGDWPAYRHDPQRSAITAEQLALPLSLAWEYHSQAPRPAWPEPHYIMLNRLDFDYAAAPVIAGGVVCFGSSADDAIRALDARTGAQRWRFATGGPIRLAPQIVGDKVYVGSDDGVVYCLDLASGKPVWTFAATPKPDLLVGNGRMISRWPIRTGVLVADGVVYLVAGMWGNEGVYVYALDAGSGKVLWCNDTAGYLGIHFTAQLNEENAANLAHGVHDGDFGTYGLTPQGPLALSGQTLLIPNGYNSPAGLDRHNGQVRFATPRAGLGGSWLTANENSFYVQSRHRNNRTMIYIVDPISGVPRTWLRGQMPQLSVTPPDEKGKDLSHDGGKVSYIVEKSKHFARRAFDMVKAGDTLFLGQEDYVCALDAASDRELWRAPVRGEARQLAVADGRLYVSTRAGVLYCFAPASAITGKPSIHQKPAAPAAKPTPAADAAIALAKEAGMDHGFALVLGDPQGALALQLAQQTQLHVICALPDAQAVAALRQHWLDTNALYGSRLHALPVPAPAQLPFAACFANLIVVAAPVPGITGSELYRVLRPAGGLWLMPGLSSAQSAELVKDCGSAAEEVHLEGNPARVIRGRLPGALDWDSPKGLDQRARWPLRPLWFGGPPTALVTDYKSGNNRPFAAAGRYFVLGETTLSAVDIYNGAILWTRTVPKSSPSQRLVDGRIFNTDITWSRTVATQNNRSVRVNDRHVWLYLGENTSHGKGQMCAQLDARNGEQLAVYGEFTAGPRVGLQAPASWTLEADAEHAGTLTLAQDAAGLLLKLAAKDPHVTAVDEWDIYLDLRPPERRYGLYGPETLHLRVRPAVGTTPAAYFREEGPSIIEPQVTGQSSATGAQITLLLPWSQLDQVTAGRAKSLGFAATLNSHDGDPAVGIIRKHLWGNPSAEGFNNGWATVVLDPGAADAAADYRPALLAGLITAVPREKTTLGFPSDIDGQIRQVPRVHPLTGELGPRIYRSGTGTCGGFDFSASSVIKRSGATKQLGIYDFIDDSGLRGIQGISAACGPSTTTAQGLVLVSEAKARCVCTYAFRTSMALAPADQRLNEDWAIFYDRKVDTQLRMAQLNLGAFGDRRDDDGALWLAFPRPLQPGEAFGYPKLPGRFDEAFIPGLFPLPNAATLAVPLTIRASANLGPYRVNADRVAVRGSNRPWVYTSGYRGIESAVLQLNFLKPLASLPCSAAPTIDGALDDPAWQGDAQAQLFATGASFRIRHDEKTLYLAGQRPAVVDRLGKQTPWTHSEGAADGDLSKDDAIEFFLTDATRAHTVHLAVSASGVRADARRDGRAAAAEDRTWNGQWTSTATADDKHLTVEVAIPLQTLVEAGIDPQNLAINAMVNQPLGRNIASEAILALGFAGRERCDKFVPLGLGQAPTVAERYFTVRLHFAEPDNAAPGRRVFAVKLQGATVLPALDVAGEAGPWTALVKEFRNVQATEQLQIDFVPAANADAPDAAPILSAIDLIEEGFTPPPVQQP